VTSSLENGPTTDEPAEHVLLSRRSLEIVVALLATGFGAAIIWGALEFDIGWDDRGPATGYFPFWVGVVVVIGGLGAFLEGLVRWKARAIPALTSGQFRRALVFLIPLVGFLIVTSVLGLYVGMTLYLLAVMIAQGGYRAPAAIGVSVGTALFFFIVFEKLLKVSLMKGPLEAWLGIH
jgi:hypothetical protein